MKLIERLKNNFYKKEDLISISDNEIYIINYNVIEDFKDNKVLIKFDKYKLIIKGLNFKIKRKNDLEIEIYGTINTVEFIYE